MKDEGWPKPPEALMTDGPMWMRLDRWVVYRQPRATGGKPWLMWPPRIAEGELSLGPENFRTQREAYDRAHSLAMTHPWSVIK